MNKKTMLCWLSLVMLVATSAYTPAATKADMLNSVSGNSSSALSNANAIQSPSQVRRVGLVVAYSPGQSIRIADRQGNEYRFTLSSPLRIVPRHRANSLGRGSFVTVIAPNNVPGGYQIAVGIVIHPSVPRGFPTPVVPVAPTTPPPPIPPTPVPTTPAPPIVFSPPGGPSIPPAEKDTLEFSSFDPPSDPIRLPIVGYTFPAGFVDWTIPIRSVVFEEIIIDSSETFTPVGIVELGAEEEPLIYLVAIDLVSTGAEVQGELISLTSTDTFDVTFQRMPQTVNPERTASSYEEFQTLDPAPETFATIFADGVCYVVTTTDGPVKFCSKPSGASDPASPLSVRDNYPSQYEVLQDLMIEVAQQFDLENRIQLDDVVSMHENNQHIQDCANELTEQACGSDVAVAPVTEQYFNQQYDQAFGDDDDDDNGGDDDNGDDDNGDDEDSRDDGDTTASQTARGQSWTTVGTTADEDDDDDDDPSSSQPTPIAVAVVKVFRPVVTADGTLRPGDYRMDYWFDSDGVFFAATVTGVRTDDVEVINQQVPAVPASLINANAGDPEQPGAQISACRLFRRCAFFQSSCG